MRTEVELSVLHIFQNDNWSAKLNVALAVRHEDRSCRPLVTPLPTCLGLVRAWQPGNFQVWPLREQWAEPAAGVAMLVCKQVSRVNVLELLVEGACWLEGPWRKAAHHVSKNARLFVKGACDRLTPIEMVTDKLAASLLDLLGFSESVWPSQISLVLLIEHY